MVVNERHDDWDVYFPHVEFACNDAVSAATGLAPNRVGGAHESFALILTIFNNVYARDHQSLAHDQLDRGLQPRR